MNPRIYLDHAATTPLSPVVFEAMKPCFLEHYGNASSIHGEARMPKAVLKNARKTVARHLGAKPDEIYFTSSGTESVNWALKGVAYAHGKKGRHIVTTAIEHHAVLQALDFLEREGFEVTRLPVDKEGFLSMDTLKSALRTDTILVSVMAANNEIGTIQPLGEIGAICKEQGILFHTDAIQLAGVKPLDVKALGIDLLSLSAHKFYGPKGVGALYLRSGIPLENLLHGGNQERGRRAGTENTPGIAGLAMALTEMERQENAWNGVKEMRDYLLEELSSIQGARRNGPRGEDRLPGNVHVSFEGVEGEALLMALDLEGIAASSGSACSSGAIEPSHVMEALGVPEQYGKGSVRFTLGFENTMEEMLHVVDVVKTLVVRLRKHAKRTDFATNLKE